MSLLVDKVVVITGSSRGIGRACAIEAAKHGANVVCHYLGDEVTTREAESLKKEIETLGRKAVIVPGDIAKQSTSQEVSAYGSLNRAFIKRRLVMQIIDIAVKAFGRVDVLVRWAITTQRGIMSDSLFVNP